MQSYACLCASQNSVNNLVKLLLIAPTRTREYFDNVQHQLSTAGSFVIKAQIAKWLKAAVTLVPLRGQSLESLLSFEKCGIHGTVNHYPIFGNKLRLLSKDSGFVLKSES